MKKTMLALLVLAATSMQMVGCAAVQHRNLETNIQMQQTIFVDPDRIDGKPIYIRVTNQTGKSDLNFDSIVSQKLQTKGYKVTKNSKEAGVRILANFVYLDKAKEGMTADGAVVGGFGGALLGGVGTRSYVGAGIGGLAGAGIGALAGSLVSVDTWYGIVDIQVEEPLQKSVLRRTKTGSDRSTRTTSASSHRDSRGASASASTQGTQEDDSMDYTESTNHKRSRTRVVAEAKQTNMDTVEASKQIKEQLADSIANFL